MTGRHGDLRVVLLAATAALASAADSRAQTAPASAPKPGMMHLAASGTVVAPPDLLVADLVAQAAAATPAIAQRRVNTMMAAGVHDASAVAGIEARATGYGVAQSDDTATGARRPPPQWTAQQTLELRGTDGPALLDLAGRLQALGFAAASIDWQLSPAARRAAYQAATTDALKQIMSRAAAAAATLGLHLGRYGDIRLDDAGVAQPDAPRVMMAAKSLEMPAPQATAVPQDITASVSVDIELSQ